MSETQRRSPGEMADQEVAGQAERGSEPDPVERDAEELEVKVEELEERIAPTLHPLTAPI